MADNPLTAQGYRYAMTVFTGRRFGFRCAVTVLAMATFFILVPDAHCGSPATDYSRLLELIRLEDHQEPLYAFNTFEDRFDPAGHRTFLRYFNEHPDLVKKIKTDLGAARLKWKLDSLEKRLLFVPENRPEYAELYYQYCLEAIDFTLREARLENPYAALVTLASEAPSVFDQDGITVFLVHNLAREFRGTYRFFADSEDEEVEVSLSSRVFIGEIGSYTSRLAFGENGVLDFVRASYTIWQNSAAAPYNALIVPLEETLHIGLRPYTESAIAADIQREKIVTLKGAEALVQHWTAVEEAAVGGLVTSIFPRLAESISLEVESGGIDGAIQARTSSGKYRFLRAGMALVQTLGESDILEMYRRDPEEFYRQLLAEEDV
jgi:hypothetical protein